LHWQQILWLLAAATEYHLYPRLYVRLHTICIAPICDVCVSCMPCCRLYAALMLCELMRLHHLPSANLCCSVMLLSCRLYAALVLCELMRSEEKPRQVAAAFKLPQGQVEAMQDKAGACLISASVMLLCKVFCVPPNEHMGMQVAAVIKLPQGQVEAMQDKAGACEGHLGLCCCVLLLLLSVVRV
jgi:hypothetical protein